MTDPVELEIVRNILASVAEEMGVALQRTAFSPNIKERRDFSCAIFDAAGDAAVMGDHMPVHLGSMPMSVKTALREVALEPGDAVILNDPFRGGTHLPDITLVSPLFLTAGDRPDLYVANRAHHSDVGGMSPGSMPLATEIFQEGLIIPPLKIVRGGIPDEQIIEFILANVRTPVERRGDLAAQLAANAVGARRLGEIARRYNARRLLTMVGELMDYSERMTRAFIGRLPEGNWSFIDFLDDDGVQDKPVRLCVRIAIEGGEIEVDFGGSDPQVAGSVNAIEAVTLSAVLYVFKSVIGEDVLANSGILRPITLIAPAGSVVNARRPAPVAGGNVETSQRIVDLLLGALARVLPARIPAASAGSMSNISFGGVDGRGAPFAYYETIAGGHGASAQHEGMSGRHSHMTNSLNSPVEALEHSLPVRIETYRLRRGSGGAGRHRGGDGILRAYRFLCPARCTVLADRHRIRPYGLAGGGSGKAGMVTLVRQGKARRLPSKGSHEVMAGDLLLVETPGGGGYGSAGE